MEVDEYPKGEMVNYALCVGQNSFSSNFDPSFYKEDYTKNLWFKAMQ